MIDFRRELKGIDGNAMTEMVNGPDNKPKSVTVTLSRLACNALLGSTPNDKATPGEEHLKRFLLAERIRDQAATVSAEELVLIKDRIAKFYPQSLVVGQAWLMLDPEQAERIDPGYTPPRDKKVAA